MPHIPDGPSPRRAFLGKVAGTAAVFAAGSSLPAHLLAEPAPTPRPLPPGDWDMSWVDRISGDHRQVFDAPEIAEGNVFHQVRVWLAGFNEVYGTTDQEMSGVMVIRHNAIPMAVNDAMWDKYELGKMLKLKDPASGKEARRNPFLNANVKPGDTYSLIWPDGGLDTLKNRGVTALACNLALHFFAGQVAEKSHQAPKAVYDELKQQMLPGVRLMPSGIFAVTRAGEAGCRYMYSA